MPLSISKTKSLTALLPKASAALLLSAGVSAGMSMSASAQEADPEAIAEAEVAVAEQESSPTAIEETVVIGSKLGSEKDNYAGSVSIIDDELLEVAYPKDVTDIAAWAPGLTALQSGQANPNRITMRGLNVAGIGYGSGANFQGTDGSGVTSYMNNIPLQGYYSPPQLMLKDLERVEVLRGPQGTLYGASSIGGVIRYETAKPQMNEFSQKFHARIGSTAESDDLNIDTDVVFNLPLAEDILAMRFLLSYEDTGGFIDNDQLIDGAKDDLNDEELTAARLSLLLTPTDAMSFSFMLHNQDYQVGDFQADNPYYPNGQGKEYTATTSELQPMEGTLNLVDITFDYDFGPVLLSLSANSYDYDLEQTRDRTEVYIYFYQIAIDGETAYQDAEVDVSQESVELRLQTQLDGPVNALFGLNYIDTEYKGSNTEYYLDFEDFGGRDEQKLKDLAAFAEVQWSVSEQWLLSAGARYFDYKDTGFDCITEYYNGTPESCSDNPDVEDSVTSFKLGAIYHMTEHLHWFANIAEGFRRGGSNPGLPDDLKAKRQYESDTTVNYELGFRGNWLDNRLGFEAALFYIDWDNVPLETLITDNLGDFYYVIDNAGKAISQGVELSLDAALTDYLSLVANYAYTDASLDEDLIEYTDYENPVNSGNYVYLNAYDGDRLPGTPKDQGLIALLFANQFGALTYDASIDMQYVGNITTQINDEHPDYRVLGGYSLYNLRLGLGQDHWRVGLFADNLSNKRAVTGQQGEYFYGEKGRFDYIIRPRTVGLDASYQF